MKKHKRAFVHMVWAAHLKLWMLEHDGAMVGIGYPKKKDSIARFTRGANGLKDLGYESELIVHNKDGSIGKGTGSHSTFLHDPKRSKG